MAWQLQKTKNKKPKKELAISVNTCDNKGMELEERCLELGEWVVGEVRARGREWFKGKEGVIGAVGVLVGLAVRASGKGKEGLGEGLRALVEWGEGRAEKGEAWVDVERARGKLRAAKNELDDLESEYWDLVMLVQGAEMRLVGGVWEEEV